MNDPISVTASESQVVTSQGLKDLPTSIEEENILKNNMKNKKCYCMSGKKLKKCCGFKHGIGKSF